MTTEQLEHEKLAVLAEIDAAFADVSREGGTSWSEAEALDNCVGLDNARRARDLDTDTHWRQVAADPAWRVEPGVGGFGFLDEIGFRYYVPAAMKQCILKSDFTSTFSGRLELRMEYRDHRLQQWSLLDKRQIRCIARFLSCMDEIHLADYAAYTPPMVPNAEDRRWRLALRSYWEQAGA